MSLSDRANIPDESSEATLLTGGKGFICNHLAKMLCAMGRKGLVQFRPGDHIASNEENFGGFTRVNLEDKNDVLRALRNVRNIVHLAHDRRSTQSNVTSLENLIEASLQLRIKRFVHVSSMAIYEPLPETTIDETYESKLAASPYATLKKRQEAMLLTAFRNSGLPVIILQPTIVYGPGHNVWTTTPARQLLSGDVFLPERGMGIAHAVHVEDVCGALVHALDAPNAHNGERFLVSGPDSVPWGEYYKFFEDELGTSSLRMVSSRELDRLSIDPRVKIREIIRRPIHAVRYSFLPRTPQLKSLTRFLPRVAHIPRGQYRMLLSSKGGISTLKLIQHLGYRPVIRFSEGKQTLRKYIQDTYA